MAYSLAGYVYDKDNIICGATVKYQGLFIKRLSGSSATKVSSLEVTDINGYYSLNLADASWLDTTGIWGNGDEVVLMFWIPNTANRTDDGLDQFAAFHFVLDNVGAGNFHWQDIRLLANIGPTCDFTLPATGYIDQPVAVTNTSSDSPHMVDTVATPSLIPVRMWQESSYSGQSIFPVCRVVRSDWDWKWVPSPGTDTETNNNHNLSHTWHAIGDYVVQQTCYDPHNASAIQTHPIRIVYPPPIPDFTWVPYPVGADVNVTFSETITDPYNRVGTNTAFPTTRYKWYVKDPDVGPSFVYQGGFDNINLIHSFPTSGDKWVRLEIYWNDGFTNHTSFVDKKIVISNTPPVADFSVDSQAVCAIDYLFTSKSYDPDGTIIYYEWSMYSLPGPVHLATAGGAAQDTFKYAITAIGPYRIVHTVTDNDGASDTKIVDFSVDSIDCGQQQHHVIDTMAVPGAYGVSPWLRKKPTIKAQVVQDKDAKRGIKLGAEVLDNKDKKEGEITWNSISIDQKPSSSS